MKKLLLVFAHPDDESLAVGGTVAKYAASGWQVYSLCLTGGEAGSTGSYGKLAKQELAKLRRTELHQAASILGIKQVTVLGYPDGKLTALPPGKLEEAIRQKMLEVSPNLVITFDPTGGTNHPDHRQTCYATTYAFQCYAEELEQAKKFVEKVSAKEIGVKKRHFWLRHKFALKQESFAEAVDERLEPKLYYVCLPAHLMLYLRKLKVVPLKLHSKLLLGTPDKKITTIIDIRRTKKLKIRAILAHESQISGLTGAVSQKVINHLLSKEFYLLRYHGIKEVYMGKDDLIADRL